MVREPELLRPEAPGVTGTHDARSPEAGLLGVVLCGGASRRMGRDKALLELAGAPLYVRTAAALAPLVGRVVLASGPQRRVADPRFDELPDATPAGAVGGATDGREGPLASLVAALEAAAREGRPGVLAAPCDVPGLELEHLAPLAAAVVHGGADVSHWRRDGRDEPLCVALAAGASGPLRAAFEAGVRRPVEAFAGLRRDVREVPRALAAGLDNVNTPDELARAAARARAAALDAVPGGRA